MESVYSRSVLPPDPPYGSNWGHKIADFQFLAYISFIVAFIDSECITWYWETMCGESKELVSLAPRTPLWVKLGS